MAESEKDGGAVDVVKKAGESVERLSDFTFALHVLPAFFALDIGLLVAHRANVFTTDWSLLSKDSIGIGLCLIVSYVATMAIGLKLVRVAVDFALRKSAELGRAFGEVLGRAFASAMRRVQERPGYELPMPPRESRVRGSYVLLRVARQRALADKDNFWIAQVQQKEKEIESAKRFDEDIARLSFATMALAVTDWLFFSGQSILSTAVHQTALLLGRESDLVGVAAIAVLLVAVALPWLIETFIPRSDEVWIEHPALAAELMDAFRKRQAEEMPVVRPWRER